MLNQSLKNTLNTWSMNFHASQNSIEKCWDMAVNEMKRRHIDGYESFDAFTKVLKERKDEILEDVFVIPGLNQIIEDTDTMKANEELAVKRGYVYNESDDVFYKTVNNEPVMVNRYMVNTHTTSFLDGVITTLEEEAKRPLTRTAF